MFASPLEQGVREGVIWDVYCDIQISQSIYWHRLYLILACISNDMWKKTYPYPEFNGAYEVRNG